jgi:hypothetical protein
LLSTFLELGGESLPIAMHGQGSKGHPIMDKAQKGIQLWKRLKKASNHVACACSIAKCIELNTQKSFLAPVATVPSKI